MRILLAIEAVDGRKGIDSLARLCQKMPWNYRDTLARVARPAAA